ncbi:MAG: FAD:protein FMN transferase [Candidatus Nanoarchaeia archaeon]
MVSRKYQLFGSEAEFYLEAEEAMSEPIMEEAYTLALKLQKIFNIYDESSEISLLNKKRKIKASKELIEVLHAALEFCELSGGEYDISRGKQFLQRKKGEQIELLSCSYRDIEIKDNNVILLNEDVWVDLGSIAKGYITEKICDFFLEQGIDSGYIDARGDLRVFGEELAVGVQHPRKGELLLSIKVKDRGVATSGDYNQYYKNYDSSHILNQKEIISATVVADDLTWADACATILMVCAPAVREKIMKKAGFPALIVDKDLNIKQYNGFEKLVINEN